MIVTENGKPIGILTERDVMKKVCPQELRSKMTTTNMPSNTTAKVDFFLAAGKILG